MYGGLSTRLPAGDLRAGSGTWSEFSRAHALLWSLTWRDLRVRYKQSVLGAAWAVVQPLSMMLVFTFVFTRAIDARSVLPIDVPYALYAYCGLVPWTLFSGSLNQCVNSLTGNRNLVTKVYFPREVLPLSCVGSALIDFLIAATVLVGLMAWFAVRGSFEPVLAWSLLFVPVLLLIQVVLIAGVGLVLAMANLFYRDVRPLFTVGVQLLMFVSAVVVPVPTGDSLLARVISLNPLVPIISGYRSCVLRGEIPPLDGVLQSAFVAVVALVGGVVVFRRASRRFAESI